MDKNQDGVISEEEFLDGCERVRNKANSLVNACICNRLWKRGITIWRKKGILKAVLTM